MKVKDYNAQLKAMLAKNGKLHIRHIGGTICEVLLPLILMGVSSLMVYVYLAMADTISGFDSGYIHHFPSVKTLIPVVYDSYLSTCMGENGTCFFAITPDTEETHSFGKQFFEKTFEPYYPYSPVPEFKYFESEDVFRSEVKKAPAGFYAGVVFKENDLSGYSLYMNSSYLPADNKATSILSSTMGFLSNSSLFVSSGFTSLQKEIDTVLIERNLAKTNKSPLNITSSSKLLPGYSAFSLSIGSIIGYTVSVFTVYGSIPLFANFLGHLISEKNAKSREFLFILGLKKSVYWLSWLISTLIPGIIYVVICIVLNYVTKALVGDVFMMIVVHLVYVVSLILFGFLLQTAIKNIVAAIICSILWVYIPGQLLSIIPVNKMAYGLLCLVSPFAFTFAVFKKSTESLATNTLVPMATDELSYTYLVSILFVDCVLYGVFSWYFNEIKAGDYGVSKPWNFLFKKSYWIRSSPEIEIEGLDPEKKATNDPNQGSFENDTEIHPGVTITKLTKVYSQDDAPPVLAVNKISAAFGENRITSLLGHNGAGKSTTINMLIGLITPTSGDANIGGKSILTDMDEIRKQIGICPQEDLIFSDLTAPEHLNLVARLRRYTSPNLKDEIKAALANMGLPESEHKNMRAKNFSGGMKRKLSLAIALFGNPKVVILDEPTTGIDAASKREIWDTFTREKEGKTIILTTHSMEEADALSDYIYIMSSGQVKCGGSSMFLKNKFGTGYYINIEKGKGFNSDTVLGIVKKTIPNAAIHSESQEVAVINVPFDFERLFPTILRELDAGRAQLGIKNYGLSLTTLEDVFIRMGTEKETSLSQKKEDLSENERQETAGVVPNEVDEKDEKVDEDSFSLENMGMLEDTDDHLPPSTMGRQFSTVFLVNWMFYARRKMKTAIILLLPLLLILVFVFPNKYIKTPIPSAKDEDVYNSLSNTKTTIPYAVENKALVDIEALNEMLRNATAVYPKVTFEEYDSIEAIDNHTAEKGGFIGGLGVSSFDPDKGKIEYTYLYNESIPGSAVQVQNLMDTIFLRHMSSGSGNKIDVWSHGMKIDREEEYASNEYSTNINFIIFALFGLLISSSLGVQRLVYERECLFKSQLFQAGMNPFVYCIGNIVALAIPILIPAVLISVFSAIIGINGSTGVMFIPFLLTHIVLAFSLAAFNYLLSKIFNKSDSCAKWIVLIQLVLSVLPTVIEVILSFYIPKSSVFRKVTNAITEISDYSTPIIPVCSFVKALYVLVIEEKKSNLKDIFRIYNNKQKWFGLYFVYLIASFVLFSIISVLVDYFVENYMFYPATNKTGNNNIEQPLVGGNENEDVRELRRRAENEAESKHDSVTTRNLHKKYSRHLTAVKDLSITIKRNECFGLLGPNGAGKTTSIQMLTGDLSPTSGTMTVNGTLMRGDKLNFFRNAHIGRCPQVDPLVDYLTPTEHVKILSRVRSGLSNEAIATHTKKIFRKIGLENYADRESVTLSGGTRRKLSVALSLLPGTQVIFLDEPSTGMDPVARRGLWNIIQEEQNKENHTVVLTTHSMEEAEAVCTNVAIITKGALTCYGSVQHLKSMFSDGYHVTVELNPARAASPEGCDQAIRSLCPFGGGIVVDAAGHRRTYNVGRVESLANLFEQLEGIKERVGIVSYMVTQTTLEDVFLMLTRQSEAN